MLFCALFLYILANSKIEVSAESCKIKIENQMKLKFAKNALEEAKAFIPKCRDNDEKGSCSKSETVATYITLAADILNGLNENDVGPGNMNITKEEKKIGPKKPGDTNTTPTGDNMRPEKPGDTNTTTIAGNMTPEKPGDTNTAPIGANMRPEMPGDVNVKKIEPKKPEDGNITQEEKKIEPKKPGDTNITPTGENIRPEKPSPQDCPKCDNRHFFKSDSQPVDCSEWYQMGKRTSGVYTIYPKTRLSKATEINVYCDMETDGGGWTVIQRRGNFTNQTDFNRDWQDYKNGFGDLTRDFWLGNEAIFTLTNQGVYSLRIDMRDVRGQYRYSQHNSFWITGEEGNYAMHVLNFTGNVTNDIQNQDMMMFSTRDRPNDLKEPQNGCALKHRGAWWYSNTGCGLANLNGKYQPGVNSPYSNWWYYWTGFTGLLFSEMKLRHRYPHLEQVMKLVEIKRVVKNR